MNHSTISRTIARGIRLSAVAALLTGLLAVTQPARADTYEVENTNDSGPGSLREAINLANINPGADTITFAAAIDGIPIVLAGAADEDANASGDLDILDGGDLTIQGNGAANTIIDGGGIDRVFHICPGSGCTNTVTLSGVTIGTTTVDGSTVSANTATFYGGGILNRGTLNVQNGSTIGGGNTATWGGGIHNYSNGTTTVTDSTVSANTANYGGGIYNESGTTTVNDSTIGGAGAGNTANEGGGIYNKDGNTMVTSSRILNNTATINGGGVFNNRDIAGATSVTGSCIVGNSATSFFNNQDAQQIATGNWWGAATGPNTPGADTYGGNVDVSGYLTEPILGCYFYVYLPLVLK
jgi:hypothetical protein